jgi:hypothetical protein
MKGSLFFVSIILLFSSCDFGNSYDYYSEYKPILMERSALENSISFKNARQMCQTGKIYFKDNYIFINEKYSGIHVIDNSNPESPENIGFITVPGSIDMAIKNNILYVDNAVDLVAIDLSGELENLFVTKRIKSSFPEHLPPDGKTPKPEFSVENRPANTVIVAWEKITE